MENKFKSRTRRARKTRGKIKQLGVYRLCIYRTPRHIYAQVIAPTGAEVVTSASTVEPGLKKELKVTGNKDAAAMVGKTIAERAREKGVSKIAFDRSGYKYHGRIKALADAARENGLEF